MTGATVTPLTAASQESFRAYYSTILGMQNVTQISSRDRYSYIDRMYMRETDRSLPAVRARAANRAGDPTKYQNMTIPVVKPQVEAAVSHQASVFLSGYPLFGVVAAPAYMDAAMQMETILEENSKRGGWSRELILFFRDCFKYDFAPIHVDWCDEVTAVVETDVLADIKKGTIKEVIWSGNKVTRLDPYNTFVDTRVKPSEVYKKGEFAGWTEMMSRMALKQFIATLPDKIIANITPAFNSGIVSTSGGGVKAFNYYVPNINPNSSEDTSEAAGETNWMVYAGLSTMRNASIDYKDAYEVSTLYCRVLPSEFNLKVPSSNTPQIYKLIFINHQHIIYCEQQTNAHGYIPILIGQPSEDGLGYQTKSMAEDGADFQSLASTYMNSIIASRRRAINDRLLYDPTRVTHANINSENPSAKIPIKPSMHGSNLSEAVYQFPYREDLNSGSMQQIQAMIGLANQVAGQNQAGQGQFVKGNKTVHEYESVMQNSNNSDMLASTLLEAQVFTPMKSILRFNTLEYQGGTTLYNREAQTEVEIDPVVLRRAVLDFKVTDGLVPADKLLNAESFTAAMQTIATNPAIGEGYNLSPMFSYFIKTQGADIRPFEKSQEQIAYEGAVRSWQQVVGPAIEAGAAPEALPPQPLPADYGYSPNQADPAKQQAPQQP